VQKVFVRSYFLVKSHEEKTVLILLVITSLTFCFCCQTACYSR